MREPTILDSAISLRKTAVYLSVINIISVALGFIFNIFLARKYGISWEVDCLFIALLIYSFCGIFGSFVTALLIPMFNEVKNKNEEDGYRFADAVFKWSFFTGLVIWGIVVNYSSLVITMFASGFDKRSVVLTAGIVKVLFIGYVFSNLISAINGILNALYYFLAPAAMGLLNPICIVSALFLLAPRYGVKAIAIGYVVSNVIQALLSVFYLALKSRWRPTLNIYHERLPELLEHSSKIVISGLIWSLRDIISRNIASHLGSGAIAMLSYADKVISTVSQTVISPVSNIFYSKVSGLIALARWDEIRDLLLRTARINISIVVFIASCIIVFLKPMMGALFLNSKFSEHEINSLYYLIGIQLFYLIILAMENPFVKTIYGLKNIKIVMVISAAGVMLFYASSHVLAASFGIYGVALSMVVTQLVVCALYFYFTRKYIVVRSGILFSSLFKSVTLAILFTTAGLSISHQLDGRIPALSVWLAAWVSLYYAASRYVLKEEWNIVRNREA